MTKIQFKLSHMVNLRHLNLANNVISRLDLEAIGELNKLISKQEQQNITLVTLDLRINALECSCNTIFDMNWMLDKKHLFPHFEDHVCIYDHERRKFEDLQDILEQLQSRCSSTANDFIWFLSPSFAIAGLIRKVNLTIPNESIMPQLVEYAITDPNFFTGYLMPTTSLTFSIFTIVVQFWFYGWIP